MLNKKGQMDGVQTFIMSIIGIAVILAVGLVVMGELKGSTAGEITSTSDQTTTIVLDQFTTIGTCISEETMSISKLLNGSGASTTELNSGNYTVVLNTINVSDDAAGTGIDTSVNISYSCKRLTSAYNATGVNITNLSKFPTWIGIIIVVALAMIVLGYFYKRQ